MSTFPAPPYPTFNKPLHLKYWKRNATLLPEAYTSSDASRLSLGFFIVAALDLLGELDTAIPQSERTAWIDWIYSLQVPSGGFRGFSGTNLGSRRNVWNLHWDPANLHNTFMGLLTLVMLGDDLGRLRREECLGWVKGLGRRDGSFGEMVGEGGEVVGRGDLRSVYCAVGVVYLLAEEGQWGRWVDRERVVRFVVNCQDELEGGLGQAWLREAHAGLNFCGMAALACLGRMSQGDGEGLFGMEGLAVEKCVGWMLQRQTSWVDDSDSEEEGEVDTDGTSERNRAPPAAGFAGRCNKMADTCYCFWNVGALALLSKESLIDEAGLKQYLFTSTQHMIGGFSKVPGAVPDLLHAYTGLATLSVIGQEGLQPLDCVLCVSKGTRTKLEAIRSARIAKRP